MFLKKNKSENNNLLVNRFVSFRQSIDKRSQIIDRPNLFPLLYLSSFIFFYETSFLTLSSINRIHNSH